MKLVDLFRFCFTFFAFLLWVTQIQATSKTWIGGVGNWNVSGNWMPNGVPLPTDTVIIGSGSIVTLDVAPVVETLIMTEAKIQGTNDLTVTGDLSMYALWTPCEIDCVGNMTFWGNVTMTNSGLICTGTLTIYGEADLGGSGFKSTDNSNTAIVNGLIHLHIGVLNVSCGFQNITVICNGGLSHEGGWIGLSENAVLNIPVGQTYSAPVTEKGILPTPPNTFGGTVNIEGVFHKTGGGVFEASVLFNNTGEVQVDNGTLSLRNGSNSTGGFNFANGCAMDLGQHYGTYDFTSCSFLSNGTASIIGYAGTTNFNSGATDLSNFVLDMYNTVNVNCDLTVSTFNLHNPGVMTVNQTLIVDGTFTNESTLTNNGTIKGDGVLVQNGVVNNNGSSFIAPGNSPGKLTVNGNLNLGATTYHCEINGTGQGTTYDWLAVSGGATLSNASLVVDWGGFIPSPGTFVILTFGSHIDTFADLTIPPVPGLDFTVNYTATQVILAAVVLPVELVGFTAWERNGKIRLDWQTASEWKNAYFEIERSAEGQQWQALGRVDGHGSTVETHDYTYEDDNPLKGINYYRILQVDFDGRYHYSDVVYVVMEDSEIEIYPNPTDGILEVRVEPEMRTSYKIMDAAGRLCREANLSNNQIDCSNLPCGMYFLTLWTGNRTFIKTVIKM